MTAPTLPRSEKAESTPHTGRASIWRARIIVVVLSIIGLALLAILSLGEARTDNPLDPSSAGPTGNRALAEVLRQRGVAVEQVGTASEVRDRAPGPGTTVVVSGTDLLTETNARTVREATRDADRLVVLIPSQDILDAMRIPLTRGSPPSGRYEAECDPGATDGIVRAGDRVNSADGSYASTDPAVSVCFRVLGTPPSEGGAVAIMPAESDRPTTVVIGAVSGLSNRHITEDAHAGVAIRALGASPRLLWYYPTLTDAYGTTGGPDDGQPRALYPMMLLLGITVVTLAVVRGRRLGRLVPERLPVVVRAIETTQSRAALYRRADDRERSAAILRTRSIDALRRRLGVTPSEPPAALITAIVAVTGDDPNRIEGLLHGPTPPNREALLDLARDLMDLNERVRRR